MAIESVHYANRANKGENASLDGYAGSGWYFWEDEGNRIGPWSTKKRAKYEETVYVIWNHGNGFGNVQPEAVAAAEKYRKDHPFVE